MDPRVLTFTSLFPNAAQPLHGLFVRERIRALAQVCRVEVVAPVPRVPPLAPLLRRYGRFGVVPACEEAGAAPAIHHPRFVFVPKLAKTLDGWLMAASCLPAVARIRRRWPFEVIDAHWAYPDGAAAALLAARLGVPYAVTVRGDDINIFGAEAGRGRIIRRVLQGAALVIAVSHDLRQRVEALTGGHRNVITIPNGIDGDRFHPVDRQNARRRLGLDPRVTLAVTVGRLHASKGLPMLVDAIARVPAHLPPVHLYVIGPPDQEADARPALAARVAYHRLAERVHMVGPQSPDALRDWYNAADLFCSATTREGSPNVLLEAMACGLPCVTTPVGGNPDAVTSPALGLLAPPEAESLGRALTEALTRRWDRAHIAAHARRRTWQTVGLECRDALRAVVEQAA